MDYLKMRESGTRACPVYMFLLRQDTQRYVRVIEIEPTLQIKESWFIESTDNPQHGFNLFSEWVDCNSCENLVLDSIKHPLFS